MTTAAVYARFSSDAQREESIEIQARECSALAGREGWEVVEVYADHAMTGRNGERPAFRRCLRDGEAGLWDVLVVYKGDRLARNVAVAQDFKRRLFAAGRRIVSVREGELTDTPDGFLVGGIGDLFAEYYSRNLSVLIRGGIEQNARNCKASGVRLFGYDVDDGDKFVPNEAEAEVVRGIYARYCEGATCKEIARGLNARGVKNKLGRPWSPNGVSKTLQNRSYIGEYSYAGVTVAGGMPAIVDEETFELARRTRAGRPGSARRRILNDYILSDKLWCLECGSPMRGTSGTGKTGRKYTYYMCKEPRCACGRIPSKKLEAAVLELLGEFLGDEANVQAMTADVMEYARSLPDETEELRSERGKAVKRRDNLVDSIAEGVPASSVRDALHACEERIAELDREIAFGEWRRAELVDEEKVRRFVESAIERAEPGTAAAERMVRTYMAAVYADRERVIALWDFGDSPAEFDLDGLRSLTKGRTPDSRRSIEGSYGCLWWR